MVMVIWITREENKNALACQSVFPRLAVSVCVFLKFLRWNPNLQCDTKRWGFGEGIKSWVWNSHEPESAFAPSAMWGPREKITVYEPASRPHQTSNLLAPWSWTSQCPALCKTYVYCLSHLSVVFLR